MNTQFYKRKERLNLFQKLFTKVDKTDLKNTQDSTPLMCPSCNTPISQYDLKVHLSVCPNCNFHFSLGVQERIAQLVDEKSFKELYRSAKSNKINDFPEYQKKIAKAQDSTGLQEAVTTGIAEINGKTVALAIMDARFIMGSMGQIVGEKITRLIEVADKKKYPLIILSASGGARMQEGILSLFQMSKTASALARFDEHGGLYISVLTHPTTGGVSASFAMLGDIIIAEPKALIGFAGRRVIEKTMNEQLPEAFQKSEFLLEKGFIDAIVHRKDLKTTLSNLILMHKVSS
ncbi:MAG: acetyl-CoA carboxylase carboxyltransferase subunit beta [Erysipelotrichaceae bacterium]|nr:acetyl-CoA carboxylase carboxyltransferase subunit beta [Erysipelotrichaceae bacterium]